MPPWCVAAVWWKRRPRSSMAGSIVPCSISTSASAMNSTALLDTALSRIPGVERLAVFGRVTRVIGQVVEASSLPVAVGEVCRLTTSSRSVLAVVAGFHERGVMLLPVGEIEGIHPGAMVSPLGRPLYVSVGEGLIGRVLDGLGRPIDGLGPVGPTVSRS